MGWLLWDSISTTVESTISAIKSVENISTIIIGGMDRGINYDSLVDFLLEGKVSNVILMYESGKKIYKKLIERPSRPEALNIVLEKDLYAATERAQKLTLAGEACILSPASASYNDFKNFEERGRVFKELIFEAVDYK